ncbi:lysis protein [Pseudomonas koreensis]|uniref:Lysis protein n=2 Tax=Pseudomonas TaxID=286 RepID=A0A4Q4L539_9PSED|nr:MULTISPECIES: lysis system i-spanin subunit Rz [Pseudomonas]MDM8191165.1 lysis system i-spanin subunit Rz [Pseudomonas fluorescens]MDP8572410.1 lysis system i-spanin subunit Rz [Pseudomonas iranensis]RYM41269.1 lysis protein [Pseudomonas koreensis]
MSILDLIPAPVRPWAIALVLLSIAGAGAAGSWAIQDWRYGNALAEQARQSAEATVGALVIEQDKRRALEQRLKDNDKTHYKDLSDAQTAQQRLSDRLATADVRLSVLLNAGSAAGRSDGVSAPASAGGVVHGAARAELDPAHARRIIGITDAGDRGLIALAACQAYAKEVSTPK